MRYFTKHGAGMIAGLYIGVTLIWIFGSDHLVLLLSPTVETQAMLQSVKGTLFVLATGLCLFFLIRLHKRKLLDNRRDAELRVRDIIADSPVPILQIDPDTHRIVASNGSARNVFALSEGTAGALTLDDLMARHCPTDVVGMTGEKRIAAWLQSGTAECALVDKDGHRRVFELRTASVVGADAPLLQVALTDVTDRAVFARVLRDLGDSLSARTGADFHEALAMALAGALDVRAAVVAQADRDANGRLRTSALARDGKIASATTVGLDGTHPGAVIDAAGEVVIREIDTDASCLQALAGSAVRGFAGIALSDASGQALGMLAVIDDKPFANPGLVADVLRLAAVRAGAELERIRAEEALRENEERFRQFTEISSDWQWEQDAEFRFTFVSDQLTRTTDFAPQAVLGLTRWELAGIDPDTDPNWAAHKATLEAQEPFHDFCYSREAPDGTMRHWRTHGTPLFDSQGRFKGYRGVALDETAEIEALRCAEQAQARLMDAIESLGSGFALYDRDERLVLCNRRYLKRGPGFELANLVGATFEEIIEQVRGTVQLHPSMGSENAFYSNCVKQFRSAPSKFQVQMQSGQWAEIEHFPAQDGGTVVLWTDITEHKQMVQDLRYSEERFRSMINDASQGIIVHTEMRPQYCNPAFAAMFGFDNVDEILALDSIEVLFARADQTRLRHYQKERAAGRAAPEEYEFMGVRHDGSQFPVRNRVVRVPWDGGHAICANMFDISEQTATAAALARSEKEFRALIEGSPQGVIVHTDNRLRFANAAAASVLGYGSSDSLMALGSVSKLTKSHKLPHAVLHANNAGPISVECCRSDGAPLFLDLDSRAVDWSGDAATQLTMTDNTYRHQAELALRRSQRLEAVGQLTGGVAHDFNNLLGIVMGNLELLERSAVDDPKSKVRIQSALRAARRGSQLTRRLLNFSSQEAQPGTPSNVNDVMAGLDDLLARSLTSGITLEIHPGADLWLTEIDPGDLEDAMLNLALNARDAMPDGGRLVIETGNRTMDGSEDDDLPGAIALTPGDYVVISVSDSGCGMPPEVMERVLEPFFTTKAPDRGTGLGLSMVYGFVKRSRGDIRFYSEIGHGTTVRLFLPRSTKDTAATTDTSANLADAALPRGTETVLLVEDEPDLLHLADHMLRGLGYTTLTATNGREALKILEDSRCPEIDLVFSDVIMPGGINGFELAERVVAAKPGTKVLLASGFTGKLVDQKDGHEQLKIMLHKPYDRNTLAHCVRQAIAGEVAVSVTSQS